MAVLTQERTHISQPASTQWLPHANAAEKARKDESCFRLLWAWFVQAGEFMLGLLLAFIGLLVRAALAVSLIVAPFIALFGMVLLFALMIEATGSVLRAIGLTR